MSKILYWNIENFNINKINNPSNDRAEGQGGLTENAASVYRRNLILNHIGSLDEEISSLDPDYIVVVEVATSATGVGDLIPSSGGLQGCSWMLDYLRKNKPYSEQDWRLVPPLKVGTGTRTESVAVFYKGSDKDNGITRYFTGPNLFNGGANGISILPGTGNAGIYPKGTFYDMLVPCGETARKIPDSALHNKGVAENKVAAKIRFQDADGKDVNFGGERQPYMATFTETKEGEDAKHVTIFGCHAPQAESLAPAFMSNLANCEDVIADSAEKEVKVICGNFNQNLLNQDGTLDTDVYKPLTKIDYELLLAPLNSSPPTDNDDLKAFKGYFATQIMSSPTSISDSEASLFLWSSESQSSFYPGYGYIGEGNAPSTYTDPEFYSVDNMLVKYGSGDADSATITVINSVVGTPMDARTSPPGNPPIGVDTFSPDMLNLVPLPPWPESPSASLFSISDAQILVGWRNYSHIHDTSSHFALYGTV